jgi:tRNA pseudouridine38-40 synthase
VPRYRLTIGYDGTDFCGWQKQEPPAHLEVDPGKVLSGGGDGRMVLRTVQEVVERAVREVVREPVELIGASRTDAGVHARGQVAAFTCSGDGPERTLEDAKATPPGAGLGSHVQTSSSATRCGWPPSRGVDSLVRAINARLPDDVLMADAAMAAPDFNPIGGATGKAYSYSLHVAPHRPLWNRRYVHHVWVPLDVARMQDAAARFIGEHDFAAFAAAGHGRLSTVRRVYECRVVEEEGIEASGHQGIEARHVRIEIAGSGFLWNMVRIIAGTLVEVGRGKMSPDDVRGATESRDRRRAGPTLPPTGLCLEWVRY